MDHFTEDRVPENDVLASHAEESEATAEAKTTADNLFRQAAVQDEAAEREKRLNRYIDLLVGVKNHERLIAAGFKITYTGYGLLEGSSGHTADRRSDGSAGKGDSE